LSVQPNMTAPKGDGSQSKQGYKEANGDAVEELETTQRSATGPWGQKILGMEVPERMGSNTSTKGAVGPFANEKFRLWKGPPTRGIRRSSETISEAVRDIGKVQQTGATEIQPKSKPSGVGVIEKKKKKHGERGPPGRKKRGFGPRARTGTPQGENGLVKKRRGGGPKSSKGLPGRPIKRKTEQALKGRAF